MTTFFYTIFIHFYIGVLHIAALWNKKAKQRINGVKKSRIFIANWKDSNDKTILIHCASQGEHEQALPIVHWIIKNTRYHILLSFYSPSGYNNANYKDNPRVTKVYLPFDITSTMSKFITKINPMLVLIVKNEWWWNMLNVFKKHQIETYLISSTIRKSHYFIRFPLRFFKDRLNVFKKIFVVDEDSKSTLSSVFKGSIIVSGDSRIDQTNSAKSKAAKEDYLKKDNSKNTIVYGSVWESDIKVINQLISFFPDRNHLIYPHKLDKQNLSIIQAKIENSNIVESTRKTMPGINIISSMGELKYAYNIATFAYIGGGFGAGIHNILEASVYYIPVIFGPNFKKSSEAIDLIQKNCAFSFEKLKDLNNICSTIDEEKNRKEIESKLKSYFSPSISPTKIICEEIFNQNDFHV